MVKKMQTKELISKLTEAYKKNPTSTTFLDDQGNYIDFSGITVNQNNDIILWISGDDLDV